MDPVVKATELAVSHIKKIMTQEDCDGQAVRVGISERTPTSFEYMLEFCELEERKEDDLVIEQDGVSFFVNGDAVDDLRGTLLDFKDNGFSSGFKFENPNKPPLLDNPLAVRIQAVLDDKVNPGVAAHGGKVTLVDVKGDVAYVQLGGGCQGCGQADTTVKQGVEAMIKEAVPEITQVLDRTDHEAGSNPYYSSDS